MHLAANVGLQSRLDIRQEKELGIFVLFWNAGLEGFEDVEVSEIRFRLVKVVGVGAAPAERLALSPFETAGAAGTPFPARDRNLRRPRPRRALL